MKFTFLGGIETLAMMHGIASAASPCTRSFRVRSAPSNSEVCCPGLVVVCAVRYESLIHDEHVAKHWWGTVLQFIGISSEYPWHFFRVECTKVPALHAARLSIVYLVVSNGRKPRYRPRFK